MEAPRVAGRDQARPPGPAVLQSRGGVVAAGDGSGPFWVDAHCHLYGSAREPGDLLARARAAGVEWVVCPGVDGASSEQSARLADRHPGQVVFTAGLHPHYSARWSSERDRIAALAHRAAALGECGLDFYRDLAPRAAQEEAFRDQLALAAELDKPIVVHCRDAFAEVHAALEDTATGRLAVLHCWTGGPRWTQRFAEMGARFSFAGPITFPTGDTVRRGAAAAPPDRTMVETDTPYLTPPPHRERENEPANVPVVGAALAEVWGEDPAEVAVRTSATAAAVFGG